MRGIVTYPTFSLDSPHRFSDGGPVSPLILRQWSLYWDKVVEPGQALVGGSDPTPDLEYLRKLGLFATSAKPTLRRVSGTIPPFLADRRFEVLQEMERQNPGSIWAISTHDDGWVGPAGQPDSALRIKLMNALPVADYDVPIDDILEFKERRRDEREALLHQIDKLYLSVIASSERPLAEHVAMKELATGIDDQIKAVQDAGFRFRLADLAADFNLAAIAVAVGGIALGQTWPEILGNGLAAGASVSVGKVIGLLKPKASAGPYRYLTSYRDEVFSTD